jgi:general secretion pathway protein D
MRSTARPEATALTRAGAALLLILMLSASCSQSSGPESASGGSTATAEPEKLTPPPMPLDGQSSERSPVSQAGVPLTPVRPSVPIVSPGTGVFVAPPAGSRAARVNVAPGGAISFSFSNADVREVAREILGNQLHLNYAVDPRAQAAITVQTGNPLPREAILPTLENVLAANGLALVETDGLYRILPLQDAAKVSAGAPALAKQPGYAIRILPLRFASPSELKTILDPFVPVGGILQADPSRNLLIVTGPASDLDGFEDLVRQFDVDWLAGTSYALYPLHVGMAKDVANELEAIFGEGGSGPLAGQIRILPIERLNAILLISPQRAYLAQVKTWIDRLDYGDDQTTPRLFEYRVQNSRALDLAAVLTQLLSSGAVSAVQAQIAPGKKAADLMSAPTAGLLGGSPGNSMVPGNTPVAAAQAAAAAAQATQGLPTYGAAGPAPGAGPRGAQAQQQIAEELKPGGGAPSGGTTELPLPPVRIVADEKNNALVIYARPRDYRMIEDMIKRLDVVPLQVLIEATIAEVTLTNDLQYGLQWFFSQGSSKFELSNSVKGIGVAADIVPAFPGFNYVLSTARVKVVLSALAQLTHVDVVSAPQLLVLDHQTAALQVGDQVPIVSQQQQAVIVPGAPIINSVQYLNTGVVLEVTPRVNTSGLVTLDIDQSVSEANKTTTSDINSPTVTQRRVVTSVIVQDGETVALGGLILDNQTNDRQGIPVLSDIPIVGNLFRTTTKNTKRTELLVLLTPRIVRNTEGARGMTDELRNRMRAVKPLEIRAR